MDKTLKTTLTSLPDFGPHKDYGFFGPDSVCWKVWSYPTSVLLGFSRAVTIEELDPLLVAAVAHSGQVKQRTPLRFDRTMQYFATVLFGDAESVLKASDILLKIHARSVGIDAVTGAQFDANDPESQLWIHVTAWHSILYTYEKYGPGKLSEAEENQYWAECARAAEFQPIELDSVPRTRDEVRRYFESYRPLLVSSELARDMFGFLANMQLASLPAAIGPRTRRLFNAWTSRAVIATFPRWMRDMGGTPQSRVTDVVITAFTKLALRLSARRSARGQLGMLNVLSPRTVPILGPVLEQLPAAHEKVYGVAEARAEFGYPRTPLQIQADYVAKRAEGSGPKPYGRGHHDPIVEFEPAAAQSI